MAELDTKTAMGYVDPAAGKIRRSGLTARNTKGGRNRLEFSAVFVRPVHGRALFSWARRVGSLRARRSPLVPVCQPMRRALFAFDRAKRGLNPQPKEQAMKSRQPTRVIPFPDRQHPVNPPTPSLLNRVQGALDELQVCLFALGIASELKIKHHKED